MLPKPVHDCSWPISDEWSERPPPPRPPSGVGVGGDASHTGRTSVRPTLVAVKRRDASCTSQKVARRSAAPSEGRTLPSSMLAITPPAAPPPLAPPPLAPPPLGWACGGGWSKRAARPALGESEWCSARATAGTGRPPSSPAAHRPPRAVSTAGATA
eukprot:6738407-Prymnesium_polylepis.3